MRITVKQVNKTKYMKEKKTHDKRKDFKAEHLAPFQWKEGQSGNPKGRPKGKTMKDYARDLLSKLTDEERQEFLRGLPKEVIWRMAEGSPMQDQTSTVKIETPIPILDVSQMKALPLDHEEIDVSNDNTPPYPKYLSASDKDDH